MSDGSLDECPICGTPVLSIEIRGPSPAERYAQPCGHQLPADFGDEDEASIESDETDDVASWQARLAAAVGDGGGCLETAQAAAAGRDRTQRQRKKSKNLSRRDLVTGTLSTAAGLSAVGSIAGALTADSPGDDRGIMAVTEDGEPVTIGDIESLGIDPTGLTETEDGELLASALTPHPTIKSTWRCNGTPSWHCIAAASSASVYGCAPCRAAPSHATCGPCAAALLGSSYLGRSSCCSGQWERTI